MSLQIRALAWSVAAALASCGPSGPPGDDAGIDAGCTGVCGTDAGSDGGAAQQGACAAVPLDGGTVTFAQLRQLPACGQWVTVQNVVVHTVDFAIDSGTPGSADISAEFYVGTPADAGPGPGVFIDKFFSDLPTSYRPAVGDRLDVQGFLYERFNKTSGRPHSEHRLGYRRELGAQFNVDGGPGKLVLTRLEGTGVTAVARVDASYSARNGTARPHPNTLGSRVFIPGPVYVADPAPSFMLRYSLDATDGGPGRVFLDTTRDNYEGFVLDNGVVIADYRVRGSSPECRDYRQQAADAGPGRFFFPNGIQGIYETYTMVPLIGQRQALADGGVTTVQGASGCPGGQHFFTCLPSGWIPSADGGVLTTHLHVVVPQNCTSDLTGGVVDAGR